MISVGQDEFSHADKKKKSDQEDVGMVTAFQETQMLKSEVVLHEAARKNHIEVAQKLIAAKVNVNCTNNLDRTPLQWAAAGGHLEMVKLLYLSGADVDIEDKYGMKAILWAAWFGHLPVIEFLVGIGAKTKDTNKQGFNLLHCATNQNGADILHYVLDTLDDFDINAVDNKGRTPLHLAASDGHLESVEVLLGKDCDIGIKDKVKCDKEGRSALHLSAINGHKEVVNKLLLVGYEIDQRDDAGDTAAHLAAENGHAEVLDLLYMHNSDYNAETNKEMTALHLAAEKGHEHVTRIIIDYGANPNAQNAVGNTALHLAALGNHSVIIRILINAGADVDLPNTRLHTPLHCAVEKGNADAVEELLLTNSSLETKEKGGRTPLYMASRGSYIGIVDMIIKADRERVMDKNKGSPTKRINGNITVHSDVDESFDSMTTMSSPRSDQIAQGSPSIGVDRSNSRDSSEGGPIMTPSRKPSQLSQQKSIRSGVSSVQEDSYKTDESGDEHPFDETVTASTLTYSDANFIANNPDLFRNRYKIFIHPYAEQMKPILYKLAYKQLKPSEWRKLAHAWRFNDEHIRAIQHQYTGEHSHREHAYRMLLIWLHGVKPEDNPMKELYEGLVRIGRKKFSRTHQKKIGRASSSRKKRLCYKLTRLRQMC